MCSKVLPKLSLLGNSSFDTVVTCGMRHHPTSSRRLSIDNLPENLRPWNCSISLRHQVPQRNGCDVAAPFVPIGDTGKYVCCPYCRFFPFMVYGEPDDHLLSREEVFHQPLTDLPTSVMYTKRAARTDCAEIINLFHWCQVGALVIQKWKSPHGQRHTCKIARISELRHTQ